MKEEDIWSKSKEELAEILDNPEFRETALGHLAMAAYIERSADLSSDLNRKRRLMRLPLSTLMRNMESGLAPQEEVEEFEKRMRRQCLTWEWALRSNEEGGFDQYIQITLRRDYE